MKMQLNLLESLNCESPVQKPLVVFRKDSIALASETGVWIAPISLSVPLEEESFISFEAGHHISGLDLRNSFTEEGKIDPQVITASQTIIKIWSIREAIQKAPRKPIPRILDLSVQKQIPENFLTLALQFTIAGPRGCYLALIYGLRVVVLDLDRGSPQAILTGHTSEVTAIAFLLENPRVLVTGSEDRTYRVWNIVTKELIYKSGIVSSAPISTVCARFKVAIGCSSGKFRILNVPAYSIFHTTQFVRRVSPLPEKPKVGYNKLIVSDSKRPAIRSDSEDVPYGNLVSDPICSSSFDFIGIRSHLECSPIVGIL